VTSQHHISATSRNGESLPLKGFDYIEIYVGNASHAMHFYRTTFGFTPVAYKGLETNEGDHASFVMEQGDIRLILTAAISPDSAVAEHVRWHGDSVKDIAFAVDDAAHAFEFAVKRGARPVLEPTKIEDESGSITKATIATFGETVHSFIQREASAPTCWPTFLNLERMPPTRTAELNAIDHVAISVEQGELDTWINFYKEVMGFHQSHQEDVATNQSAMNSKVVQDSTGYVKFPIMEPAPGKRKSQIEEFIAFHRGAGAQHVALLSNDIVQTVGYLRENNIDFLRTPETYYKMLDSRVGKIEEDIADLRRNNILVDRDRWGYLLQVFTKPLQSRPTLFFEVIQRVGARGFGGGNIKALFEALEREQALRGNL
jgi:4-hydroxyphenylpyruvate dioxygenase